MAQDKDKVPPTYKSLTKHICQHYRIVDGRTVCVYCGKEMEL